MDFATLIPWVLRLAPSVLSTLNTGVSFSSVLALFEQQAPALVPVFEQLGAKAFPKLAPALHAVAGIVVSFNPDFTKWVQNSVNALVTPSPNIVVDGHYGPKTQAAVIQLQTQLGLKPDGFVGDISSQVIQAALNKLLTH